MQARKEPLPEIDQRLLDQLTQAQERHRLFPAPARPDAAPTPVVVAVSGGADSVALLHLLTRVQDAWALDLLVAHLDHNLRPESAADARFVAELAERWGLPFESARLPAEALAQQGNLEAAARQARYRFLAQIAARRQAETPGCAVVIAVAHTANDQAETVLMNLIRGSGLDGLAGMPPKRPLLPDETPATPISNISVVRPLLGVSRAELLQYLNAHEIPWQEDPTNRDQSFVRNRIRHDILPRIGQINPQIVSALCRTAAILSAEAARVRTYNRQSLSAPLVQAQRQHGDGRRVFDLAQFQALDVAAQRSLLRATGLSLGQPSEALSFESVERIRQQLLGQSGAGGPFSWVGDLMLTRAHDSFSLHRQEAEPYIPDHPHLGQSWLSLYGARVIPVPGDLTVGDWTLHSRLLPQQELAPDWPEEIDPWEAYIDAGKVGELLLTGPHPGQRFAPFGMAGHGKALADYFTDRKVIRSLRAGWPIVLDSDSAEVVWVGGHQIADWVRITPRSREILHLRWEPSAE